MEHKGEQQVSGIFCLNSPKHVMWQISMQKMSFAFACSFHGCR